MAIEFEQVQPPEEAKVPGKRKELFAFGSQKITDKDRMFLIEQLALLLETGSTLYQALQIMEQQSNSPAMTTLLSELGGEIASGRSFSQAMEKYPEVFSSTYVHLVRASEDGGFLHQVLTQLLDMEEKREQLKSTVFSALAYPVFLSLFSFSVVIFVLVVVFPKFQDMFVKIQDQLPVTTIALMWASDMLRLYWLHITVMLGALVIMAYRWSASVQGSQQIDRLKLRTPVLKHIFMQVYLIQCMKVLSLSLSNGVTVVDALRSCKDVVDNYLFREFFVHVQQGVQQGQSMGHGFAKSNVMPALVQQMVQTGESSGNLPKVMARLAEFYEREITKKLAALSKVAEPMMLLIMGLVVGLLVSSLILPIFKLSRAVG